MIVFLCHSSGDKPRVRDLYQRLLDAGIDPWLDEEDLLPGQHWEEEIPQAVERADAVIVCLSRASIAKDGYVQKEIGYALDKVQEKPEGVIYLIPARLEEVDIPRRLRQWHRVDLFEERGFERLMATLEAIAESAKAATTQSQDIDGSEKVR